MNRFATQLRDVTRLPPSEIAWFMAEAERRSLARGDVFCRIDQAEHEFTLLLSGILQVHRPTSAGEHVVLDFIFPGAPVVALDAAIRGVPSEVQIDALAPAEMLVWPYDLRQVAFQRHPLWREFERFCLEQAFMRKHQRFLSLRTETSKERFDRLRREFPPEWTQIPQNLIASYLDITPQYLSRLRRESGLSRRPQLH